MRQGENTMLHIIALSILSVIAIFGSVGNIFIIIAVSVHKRLRVKGNAFIVNLAIADLIVTSYIIPIGLASSQYGGNPFSKLFCDVNAFLIMTTCGASTQSLMMIALERYFHICKAHWYRRVYTKPVVVLMVIFTWLFPAIWTCQGWTGWTEFRYSSILYVCLFSARRSYSYGICLAVFCLVIPMMILSVCYYKIFRTVKVRRETMLCTHLANNQITNPILLAVSKTKSKRLQKERNLVITLFTIVLLFILFWLPTTILMPISGLLRNVPHALLTVSVWLALCNSCVNSIVYGVMNKNFRRAYVSFFKSVFFCCASTSDSEEIRMIQSNSSREDSASNTMSRLTTSSMLEGSYISMTTDVVHDYGSVAMVARYQGHKGKVADLQSRLFGKGTMSNGGPDVILEASQSTCDVTNHARI